MKKLLTLLLVLIMSVTVMAGCGSNSNSSDSSTKKAEETKKEEKDTVKIELPKDFVMIEEKNLTQIPNKGSLDKLLTEALQEIGVNKVIYKAYGESSMPENGISTDIEVFIVTDTNKQLMANFICMLRNKEWSVSFIKDALSNKVYYAPSISATVDIYDYVTGELVSEKSMSQEEFAEKIKQEQEEADKKFEEELERIKKKYTN